MEVYLHAYSALVLDGGVFIFILHRLVQGEAASSTLRVGDLLYPRFGLYVVEKRKGKICALLAV